MSIEVEGPDGVILEFPDGTSRETMRAAMARRYPKNAAAPKPKAEPAPKKKSFWEKAGEYGEAALTGVAEGMRPVAELAEKVNPVNYLLNPIEEFIQPGVKKKIAKAGQKQAKRVEKTYPKTFTGGKIAGEILATAPAVAGLGAGVKALSTTAPVVRSGFAPAVKNIGTAIQTGGIGTGRTAAETAGLGFLPRVNDLLGRSIGGGISAASSAALTGQDVKTIADSAAWGMGLPIVASVVKRLAGQSVDLLRMSDVRAGKVLREALGKNVDATRRVLASLSPDDQRLVQQVLIEKGIEPRPFMGLGKTMGELINPDETAEILAGQTAARDAALEAITGGTTATQRRQAIEFGRRGVSASTTPLREAAFQTRGLVEVEPIIDALRAQANSAGIKTSSARNALLRVAKNIENGADVNGYMRPEDLYTIRKEAGDVIEKLVSSKQQPSSGSKKFTAGVVTQVKQFIDDALGPDFQDYLAQHRTGMAAMDRQELAAEAANLAQQENTKPFIALMGGQRDKVVEDVMGRGTGQYDIADLARTDPARFNVLMQTAQELNTLNRMRELGREGVSAAGNIMRAQQPGRLERGLGMLLRTKYPALAFAGTGVEDVVTARVTPYVQKRLANAFVSGPAMRQAMETYPTSLNISEGVSRAPALVRNVMAQAAVKPFTTEFPAVDPDTGEVLLDVGYNEDGTPYPIYGAPRR